MPRSALAFVLAWYTGIYDGGEQDLFPDHSLLVRASAARLIYSASSHKRTNDRPEQEPPTQRMRPSNDRFVHTTLSLATLSMQPWLASIALLMAPAPPTRCAITHFQTMLLAFQICGAPRLRTRSTWSASWAIPRRFGPRLCSACYRISFTVTLARTACQSAIRSGIMWSALSTDCVQYANMSSCSYIQCP